MSIGAGVCRSGSGQSGSRGADEEWRSRTGRAITAADLEKLLRRYPGDL
jgi:hypothetical protein